MSTAKDSRRVGDICKHILRKWKGRSRLLEGMALFYWPKIAGPEIARKTRAERMMAGTLWIRTDDPTLAHHLTFLNSKMVDEYAKSMGPNIVRGIRFVVGQIEKEEYEPEIQVDAIQLPEYILESAAAIEDENLRSSFIRTAQNSLISDELRRQKGWKRCSCGILTEYGEYCAECQRREDEEKSGLLYFFLARHPELPWEEALPYLPGIERYEWEKARLKLQQKYEENLRILTLNMRKSRKYDFPSLIEPAKKYLVCGGSIKNLKYVIGMDCWKEIQPVLDGK